MTIQIPLNQCARPSGSPNSERMHFGFEFFQPFAPETINDELTFVSNVQIQSNELVIVTKSERKMKQMMRSLGKKKLEVNVEKTKMMVFN
jgi:hypothetical protein